MTAADAREWVELSELLCPGCREHVHPEPPTTQPPDLGAGGWSHRDGSPLCGSGGGRARGVEPIEWPQAAR